MRGGLLCRRLSNQEEASIMTKEEIKKRLLPLMSGRAVELIHTYTNVRCIVRRLGFNRYLPVQLHTGRDCLCHTGRLLSLFLICPLLIKGSRYYD